MTLRNTFPFPALARWRQAYATTRKPVSIAYFHLVLLLQANDLFRRIGIEVEVGLNRKHSAA